MEWNDTSLTVIINICSLLRTHIIYYHDSNKMRQFRHEIIMNVSLMWHSVLLRSSRRQLHGANVTSEQFVPHTGSLWRLHRFNLNRFQRNRRGKEERAIVSVDDYLEVEIWYLHRKDLTHSGGLVTEKQPTRLLLQMKASACLLLC